MSRSFRLFTAAAFLLVFLVAALPSARACEPGTCLLSTWPQDGREDVPLDARIWVSYDVAGDYRMGAEVRDESGELVEVTIKQYWSGTLGIVWDALAEVVPVGGWQPEHTYTAVLGSEGNACGGPHSVSFTTGTAPEAPLADFDGELDLNVGFIEGMPRNGTCDTGPDRWSFSFPMRPVEGAVAYAIYVDGVLASVSAGTPAVLEIEGTAEPAPAEYELRVINAAGIEDSDGESSVFSEPSDPGDPADSDDDSSDELEPTDPAASCSLGEEAPARQLLGIAALLLGLVGLRRREARLARTA